MPVVKKITEPGIVDIGPDGAGPWITRAYVPIVTERSSGQLATAYLHAGGLLWVYDEAEVPAGAVALYRRSDDQPR